MNDYDKAFEVICNRYIAKMKPVPCNKIYSFYIDENNFLYADLAVGFAYVYNAAGDHFLMHGAPGKMTNENAVRTLMKICSKHDVFIGRFAPLKILLPVLSPVKILSKNETLESLSIEHDMSLKTLEI